MLRISSQVAVKRASLYHLGHKTAPLCLIKRHSSSSSSQPVTIYTGPLANVAKKLKLFSITSLGLGVGISPFVFAIDVPVPFIAKAALVGAAVATSAASTGLIQWVMSPYVTKITIPEQPKDELPKALNIHTLSFTAKDYVTTVPVDSLGPASRIFTSWMVTDPSAAKGQIGKRTAKPRSLFYVHPELCVDDEKNDSIMKRIVEKTGIGKGF
ncbi:MAG: hypothetical protein EXX96DRAFT_498329 [Benjaminiella poitrasii]|nr:MAG: hypothetical protein EXX96DRAFT_498329 [Benjaminiella poitrasii]